MRGYQCRSNILKDENGDRLVDSHNILNRWKNYFSQLLNVHDISDARQLEMHMAEPLVSGPVLLSLKLLLQSGKSINHQEMIKFWEKWLNQEVKHYCLWSTKEELHDKWKEYIIVPIHKKGDKTDCNNYRGI
jgi:hypothetical protein